jgi:hypothetical protein
MFIMISAYSLFAWLFRFSMFSKNIGAILVCALSGFQMKTQSVHGLRRLKKNNIIVHSERSDPRKRVGSALPVWIRRAKRLE